MTYQDLTTMPYEHMITWCEEKEKQEIRHADWVHSLVRKVIYYIMHSSGNYKTVPKEKDIIPLSTEQMDKNPSMINLIKILTKGTK